jgi:hypothetical protein
MNKIAALSFLIAMSPLLNTSLAQSPVDTGKDDVGKRFVGMWRLVSHPQRLADGTTRQSPQSVARIVITDTGHMCFVGMDPNRPGRKSPGAPTPEEALQEVRGFAAYCAAVELHAKEGFIIQHREVDENPNGVGSNHKRWFTFEGTNRLSLRIDTAELNPPVVEDTLIWERVTSR